MDLFDLILVKLENDKKIASPESFPNFNYHQEYFIGMV